MSDEIAIACTDLTRTFGSFVAVDHLTFEVRSGEVFGFLGANGAGKTTAMRMLIGLLAPSAGSATVAGFDVRTQTEAVKQRIGYMSQRFSLYEDLSPRENLIFFGRLYGAPRPEERAEELLESFGLAERSEDPVRTYSRGMQQRLSVARALVHEPAIVFLDEPFTGLDPAAATVLERTLAELRSQGRTLIVTTHDLPRGIQLSDRWLILVRGRIAGSGRSEEVDRLHFEEHYLQAVARARVAS